MEWIFTLLTTIILVFNSTCIPIENLMATDFTSPVGTEGDFWPTEWYDASPYGALYGYNSQYHTGSDLNLRTFADTDLGEPVYASERGIVTFSGMEYAWGNLVVIRHIRVDGSVVYTRYGHLEDVFVEEGDFVERREQIGTVGKDYFGGPAHLHFDVSLTDALLHNPTDWPGRDLNRVYRDYVDPEIFIASDQFLRYPRTYRACPI